jgi:hypothetical protein
VDGEGREDVEVEGWQGEEFGGQRGELFLGWG